MGERIAGVNNIFEDDNISSDKIFTETEKLIHFSPAVGAFIRSKFDKRNFAVNRDFTKQVCGKKKCSIQHGNEHRIFSIEVSVDFLRDRNNGFADLFFRDE